MPHASRQGIRRPEVIKPGPISIGYDCCALHLKPLLKKMRHLA
jgi:hypothetical protein